jgi:predicted nucleic acid-binding protein
LSSDFQRTLRRLKPGKYHAQLKPRSISELPFVGTAAELPNNLLYDTTVYIDVLQGRFPHKAEKILRAAGSWHSAVTESELAAACGLLNPGHSSTRQIIEQITTVINRRSEFRTLAPDREIWREAGILSGILGRLQGYASLDRRRVLNDALIFSTARKYGLTVFTRNIKDFDLLQQLVPSGRVLFYVV